jgi:transcriptional regulator with XRE-family HTH domain
MEKYFEILEKERIKKGLTIAELCKKAGVEPATYHNAKSGRTGIGSYKFTCLFEAVDIDLYNLIINSLKSN